MLPLMVIAGLAILVITTVIYRLKKSVNSSNVPGLDPVTKEEGNLGDMAKAGSLHEFLSDLHKQFGPIASFWWGTTYVVSIANAELFKQNLNAYDRPMIVFKLYEPLFGAKSITYANGDDCRTRLSLYDKCLTHMACQKYFITFQEVANDISNKWETMLNGEHIPLTQYLFAFALKSSLASLFGELMKNDKDIFDFRKSFDVMWSEMELKFIEPPTAERETNFLEEKSKLEAITKRMMKYRKENPPQHGEEILLDLLLDYTDDEECQLSDTLTFFVASFNNTGNMLSWAMYYLAKHQDCQDKVVAELRSVLGAEDLDHASLNQLTYLNQVFNETLRCAVLAPFTARVQDFDTELSGHKIPKNTPVIQALGVAFKDETVFPQPEIFDPDRFSHENSRKRPHLAFSPSGFAGKRTCPGKRFAYMGATVAVATILQKYKVTLIEGQIITPVHGIITRPKEEIWITLSKRYM